VVDSLLSIPGVTVEIIQEVFALNLVGAFDTFATAVRDSVVAIGEPLLDSVIWRNQKYLVVQAALESAVPRAWIDLANGFLAAGNVVTTSLIQGTQDLVAAVLTFNLSNIIDATLDGTKNFFVALGDGAESIIAGIEAAQRGITAALATPPPPPPDFGADVAGVADVAAMRTLAVDNTVSLAGDADAKTLAAPVALADVAVVDPVEPSADPVDDVVPSLEDTMDGEADVVDTEPAEEEAPNTSPASDISEDEADPADETPKDDEDTVKKVTPKAPNVAGSDKDAGAKNEAGSETKSGSDSDD
jgi:hypothetical protein